MLRPKVPALNCVVAILANKLNVSSIRQRFRPLAAILILHKLAMLAPSISKGIVLMVVKEKPRRFGFEEMSAYKCLFSVFTMCCTRYQVRLTRTLCSLGTPSPLGCNNHNDRPEPSPCKTGFQVTSPVNQAVIGQVSEKPRFAVSCTNRVQAGPHYKKPVFSAVSTAGKNLLIN